MQTFVFYHYILFLHNERKIKNIAEVAISCVIIWQNGQMSPKEYVEVPQTNFTGNIRQVGVNSSHETLVH